MNVMLIYEHVDSVKKEIYGYEDINAISTTHVLIYPYDGVVYI